MTISLHTIKKNKSTLKIRKRIGRGNASGTGTYAGKGLKGQNARAGVSGLKRMGMKQVLLRTPKKRGFKSLRPKAQVVNLVDLNKHFKNNDEINPRVLLEKGLIDKLDVKVKILGKGKLTVKGLKLTDVLMSETAKKQIEKK